MSSYPSALQPRMKQQFQAWNGGMTPEEFWDSEQEDQKEEQEKEIQDDVEDEAPMTKGRDADVKKKENKKGKEWVRVFCACKWLERAAIQECKQCLHNMCTTHLEDGHECGDDDRVLCNKHDVTWLEAEVCAHCSVEGCGVCWIEKEWECLYCDRFVCERDSVECSKCKKRMCAAECQDWFECNVCSLAFCQDCFDGCDGQENCGWHCSTCPCSSKLQRKQM